MSSTYLIRQLPFSDHRLREGVDVVEELGELGQLRQHLQRTNKLDQQIRPYAVNFLLTPVHLTFNIECTGAASAQSKEEEARCV